LIYLEDLEVGPIGAFGTYEVSEEEIIEFGERYNPLGYHTQPDEQSPFGGIVATGWQTGAIMMRLATENWLVDVASMGGIGMVVRFWRPVRPGDRLGVRLEVLSLEPSERRLDRGTVRWHATVVNQDEASVLDCEVSMRVARAGRG
jgi:acyl dehydratase